MIHGMQPNWCRLFRDEDYDPIAFADDLFVYYIFGPGRPENSLVALPIYQDLIKSMENFILEDKQNTSPYEKNKPIY